MLAESFGNHQHQNKTLFGCFCRLVLFSNLFSFERQARAREFERKKELKKLLFFQIRSTDRHKRCKSRNMNNIILNKNYQILLESMNDSQRE